MAALADGRMGEEMTYTLVNYYIQIPSGRKGELDLHLRLSGFPFYDATEFDSCTSGPCALETLDEIECAMEGK